MNAIKYAITGALLLLLTTVNLALANSYTIKSVPNPYQQSEIIYVVDPDNVLTEEDTDTINQRLKALEQATNIETVVVALPSVGQVDTREFANKLFNHWKIGKKSQGNGLLILLVIDQRKVVFEVGYGLEGNLTDAKSYRLMAEYMLPLLKQNQFSLGMTEGVEGTASYLEQQYANGTLYSIGHNQSFYAFVSSLDIIGYLGNSLYVAIAFAILIVIYSFWGDRIFTIRNWYKAKYVTPFSRFKKSLLLTWVIMIVMSYYLNINFIYHIVIFLVLILSIILGAFLSIFRNKNKGRQKKLICPTCRHRSIIEMIDNKKSKLSKDEQYLMSVGAVTYRLFYCDEEPCNAAFKGSQTNAGWTMCSHCQLPTKNLIKVAKIDPTYQESGLLTLYYHCVKCLKDSKKTRVIPRKQESSSSSDRDSYDDSSSSRSSSSSSRDSSSDSDSGSRGGGSSGGGGASGSF
ncbi:TPM domain-containing protein [Orbus wheelerorum]|uniref:TPM domain-containing protein n=1 Tax=Orbus wheelerorum TaxID=3074111 RepID=UPI00370D9067